MSLIEDSSISSSWKQVKWKPPRGSGDLLPILAIAATILGISFLCSYSAGVKSIDCELFTADTYDLGTGLAIGGAVAGVILAIRKGTIEFLRMCIFGTKEDRQKERNAKIEYRNAHSKNIQTITADGRIIEGQEISPQAIAIQKIVHIFGGKGACGTEQLQNVVKAYIEKGFKVYYWNYGGFGYSQGKPSKRSVQLDAEAAFRYTRSSNNLPVWVHGYSLGSYAASYLRSRYQVEKTVLDRPFIKSTIIAQRQATEKYAEWIGKIGRFLTYLWCDMDNEELMKKSNTPIAIVRAWEDDILLCKETYRLIEASNNKASKDYMVFLLKEDDVTPAKDHDFHLDNLTKWSPEMHSVDSDNPPIEFWDDIPKKENVDTEM